MSCTPDGNNVREIEGAVKEGEVTGGSLIPFPTCLMHAHSYLSSPFLLILYVPTCIMCIMERGREMSLSIYVNASLPTLHCTAHTHGVSSTSTLRGWKDRPSLFQSQATSPLLISSCFRFLPEKHPLPQASIKRRYLSSYDLEESL